MVSAFEVDQVLVLTHRPYQGEGKEIAAIRSLLDALNITGCLLTADALHCQVETLQKVVDKAGNMLVQAKQNHSLLLNDIDAQFQAYWGLSHIHIFCCFHTEGLVGIIGIGFRKLIIQIQNNFSF